MRIRNAQEADTAHIAKISAASFSEPWKENDFLDTLYHENVIFLVAEEDGIAGYGMLYCNLDEGEIPEIAVDAAHRGEGVGTFLLKEMLRQAHTRGVGDVYLEVRVSNVAAQRLYANVGFLEAGRRRDFYKNPTEDAFVLRCDLTKYERA